jgi:hypothetical protein
MTMEVLTVEELAALERFQDQNLDEPWLGAKVVRLLEELSRMAEVARTQEAPKHVPAPGAIEQSRTKVAVWAPEMLPQSKVKARADLTSLTLREFRPGDVIVVRTNTAAGVSVAYAHVTGRVETPELDIGFVNLSDRYFGPARFDVWVESVPGSQAVRAGGYYWVRLDGADPSIAEFSPDTYSWFVCGDERDHSDGDVDVLHGPLEPDDKDGSGALLTRIASACDVLETCKETGVVPVGELLRLLRTGSV